MASTTNGTHSQTNGSHPSPSSGSDIPATDLLATFISNANTSQVTEYLKVKIKELILDYIGVTLGALHHADSTTPIYNAIKALQTPAITSSTPGVCTVIGKGPPHFLPQYASLLNATFAHSLDFDDTHAGGTLHPGVTTISAALTQAEILANNGHPPTGEEILLAIAVGYEITCRLGVHLGYEAYTRGFHNTATAGIFGSIATLAVLRHSSKEAVLNAFGLAGSKAAGSLQYLENGSWNKRLHAGFAVHDAFMCLILAEAGVVGAAKVIEGKNGFLRAYSPNPVTSSTLSRLTANLGKEWEFLSTSLKPFPACRMTHTLISLCNDIQPPRTAKPTPSTITSVEITVPPANHILIGDPIPNKIHPTNPIDAQFSAYFQAAHALLYGTPAGSMEAYSRLDDPEIYALSEKITVSSDGGMRNFAGRVRIRWKDGGQGGGEEGRGKETIGELKSPLGEVDNPFTREKVEEKFYSLATPAFGKEKAEEVVKMVEGLEEVEFGMFVEMLR
jgi:2-methylcitrate dehydratase PrpD